LKIVHIMNWYIPNMGYQENYLPMEQKKLGHDVEIITSDRFPALKGFKQHVGRIHKNRVVEKGTFTDKDVVIHRLPTIIGYKSKIIILKGLKKKLMQINPNVIQAHGVFSIVTLQTLFYMKDLNYKLFIDDHCHDNNFNQNSIQNKLYIKFVKQFYDKYGKRISYFLPVTYSSKNIIKSTLDIPDNKIELLHLGVDSNFFRPSEDLREKCRKQIGIDDNEILILTSGKFTESKDIHILIKSFIKLTKKFDNIRLLILGNGPLNYIKYLYKLIEIGKIKDKVIFHDFVPNRELPLFYNAADIGVWPGDHTITAVEAISTGLPIIVPSSDKAYQILLKNNAAIGFERGNIESLSLLLSNLLQDENLRNKLKNSALELINKELAWSVVSERSIKLYLQTTGEPK